VVKSTSEQRVLKWSGRAQISNNDQQVKCIAEQKHFSLPWDSTQEVERTLRVFCNKAYFDF
jgi:hypothetical protein